MSQARASTANGYDARLESFETRVAALRACVGELEGALVAFSGGVDSTALLWVCAQELGRERCVAVTADSPSYPRSELAEARSLAASLGVEHHILETRELERAGYRANSDDRCYYCKSELFDVVASTVRASELPAWPIVYGAIADDLSDHRPGHRAADEHGVRAPLAECGMSKADVRRLSHDLGLPTATKPALACLSSRVAYGTSIDAELLARIERAEDYLRTRGFRQYRVRHHGAIARVEVEVDELPSLAGAERAGLVECLRELGWTWVTIDLAGFRSGSMNDALDV